MSGPTDGDLLRRFAALKSSSSPEAAGPSKSANHQRHVASAAAAAEQEQADLEAIADGRPLDPGSRWGSVRPAKKGQLVADSDINDRHDALRGALGAVGDTAAWDDDDEDVRPVFCYLFLSLPTVKRAIADAQVEAFLASLSAESGLDEGAPLPATSTPSRDVDNISNEAAGLLRQAGNIGESPHRDEGMNGDADDDQYGGETEEEILERARAEARLEDTPAGSTSSTSGGDNEGSQTEFAFPPLPTHQPKQEPEPGEVDDPEADARMALLLGLSGPTARPGGPALPEIAKAAPGSGKQPGQGWNLPGWQDGRDEDLDSWCCEACSARCLCKADK